MDPVTKRDEIHQVMEELNCSEEDALFVLAHQYGPNRGDIKSDPPLTEEDWHRLGLDVDPPSVVEALKRIGDR